jgi:hypothetical protein
MACDMAGDTRPDPRVTAFLADGAAEPECDVGSRETLLAEANSVEARAGRESYRQLIGGGIAQPDIVREPGRCRAGHTEGARVLTSGAVRAAAHRGTRR